MSVRRPAPLVAQHEVLTVGALADRLPGSTRLSQVLAAGAKHVAKHKTADTEAPGKRPIEGEVGFRSTIQRPIIAAYVNNLNRAIAAFLEEQAAGKLRAMQASVNQAHSLVASIAKRANSIEDMEVLRRMGAYFVLNWLYQHGTPQQSANAQLVLSEALHGEDDDEFQNILTNLHEGVTVLGLPDGTALALAHPDRGGVVLNGPGPSDFNDTRKAEKRQKVEDEREAKLQRRQQDMKDEKISEELEKDVEKKADAEMPQDGEVIAGVRGRNATNDQLDQSEAEQQVNSEMNSGNRDYEDPAAASDDEGDDEDPGRINEDAVRQYDDPENRNPRRGAQDFN